jgi:large exoprotein involved in heme utilization and adhesion
LTISAPQIAVGSRARITSTTAGPGAGGSITLNTPGTLLLDGAGAQIAASSIGSQSGPGGQVTIASGALTVQGGAQIASTTAGSSNGGIVRVSTGTLSIVNQGVISSSTFGAGNAGTVVVTAGGLSLANSSEISSATFGSGAGGSVLVEVAGALSIDGLSSISANTANTGNTGAVTISAGTLSLTNQGEISSSTFGTAAGGVVAVNVPGLLSIDGSGSGISAIAGPGSTGPAGSLSVTTGALAITNGGEIAANTFGPRHGGDASVNVAGSVTLDAAGIDANAERDSGGNGGDLNIRAGRHPLDHQQWICFEHQLRLGQWRRCLRRGFRAPIDHQWGLYRERHIGCRKRGRHPGDRGGQGHAFGCRARRIAERDHRLGPSRVDRSGWNCEREQRRDHDRGRRHGRKHDAGHRRRRLG